MKQSFGSDVAQVISGAPGAVVSAASGQRRSGSPQISSGACHSSRPIDLVHLSKFTLGNRELEAELLGLFKSQSHVYLDRMVSAETFEEWTRAAHSLKGSARAVGAWTVGTHAESAEKMDWTETAARHEATETVRREVEFANRYIDDLFAE